MVIFHWVSLGFAFSISVRNGSFWLASCILKLQLFKALSLWSSFTNRTFLSAGHDFGPGVSTLTTELLHHVCLAVYAVCSVPLFFLYVELQITHFKIYPCHYHDRHHNRQICNLQITNCKMFQVSLTTSLLLFLGLLLPLRPLLLPW